jgi:cytidylate kinase
MVAPDAVYIDTTGVPIADVTRQVEALVKQALARAVEPQEADRNR